MARNYQFVRWITAVSLCCVVGCAGSAVRTATGAPRVRLVTELGDIVIELQQARAPRSAASFLRYVDDGGYSNAAFYRVVSPENDHATPVIHVIQGGITDIGGSTLEPVPHESTAQSGLRHADGAVSLARAAPGTGSAAAFFISIGAQPALDFGGKRNPDGQGYAVFGQVISGMDVVKAISKSDADKDSGDPLVRGQILRTAVRFSASRIPD